MWHTGSNRPRRSRPATAGSTRSAAWATRATWREDLAVTVSLDALAIDLPAARSARKAAGAGTVGGLRGAVRDPVESAGRAGAGRSRSKPYLSVGIGPVRRTEPGELRRPDDFDGRGSAHSTVSAQIGGGFDVHVARAASLGITVGVQTRCGIFSDQVGLRDKLSNGLQVHPGPRVALSGRDSRSGYSFTAFWRRSLSSLAANCSVLASGSLINRRSLLTVADDLDPRRSCGTSSPWS